LSDKKLKSRFEISSDELNHRMELQQKYHDEPLTRAGVLLQVAMDKVLTKLGVDVKDPETIAMQMINMGIFANSIEDEAHPKLNGIYVSLVTGHSNYTSLDGEPDIIPYAFIGNARLSKDGRCRCDITYWNEHRLDEISGDKIITT
jgi:hypothetical protein